MSSFNIFEVPKKQKRKKNLMEFRAGKMKMNEDNWVYPDKRKGLVYIHQTVDGLMHFCWKDRQTGNVEDDLIIFPDETVFKRLPECKTGRVFLLRFKDTKKIFLWMQEPKEDNDAELCRKVNEILNQKPKEGNVNGARNVNMTDLTELIGELNEIGALNDIDLMELFSQGFASPISNESDVLAATHTTPFPIGSNFSVPTEAERHNSVPSGPFNQLTKAGISSLDSQNSKDLFGHLSDDTLKKLSDNKIFRDQFIFLDKQKSNDLIEKFLTKDSKEHQNAMTRFSDILSDEITGRNFLKEMGIPETVISGVKPYNLVNVINALEQYYSSLNKEINKE